MSIDNLAIMACRYAHNRNTSASYAVVRDLKKEWHSLHTNTKIQILKESHEAQYCHEDWEELREFAKKR